MNKEFLKKLLETPSPSGNEKLGLEVWREEMKEFGEPEYTDKAGNTAFSIGTGPKKILLSGHIDEICMGVRHITDSGFIVPCGMAGVDKKVLPGHSVIVLTDKDKQIHGVTQKNPIHIEWHEDKLKDKVLDYDDLRIDIGASSKEEVQGMGVHVGDLIVLGREINLEFGKCKFHGNSLDDKAGVFVVSEVLRRLKNVPGDWMNKYTVLGMACIGEESGLLGARQVSHRLGVDISIDLDVTHASDTGQFDETKWGDIKLGGGPVIEFGQDKSSRLNRILLEAAGDDIKCQRSISRIGGTNTCEFFLGGQDTETTLISLPLLSMHTPIETMNWNDIEDTIDLLERVIVEEKL